MSNFELIHTKATVSGNAAGASPVSRSSGSPALARALEITSRLQTSLDPERLIEMFAQEVRESVPFDGMRYHHEHRNLVLQVDSLGANTCSYKLTIENEYLGEITFGRRSRFSEEEVQGLEHLLVSLLYPLRNALRYQEMVDCARLDPLTGIQNRASLNGELARNIKLARRHGSPFSLLVMDLDHFKSVNDDFGHAFGDKVLRAFTDRSRSCMRDSDQFFRYGGEEFVALLPNTDQKGALQLAERIRKAMASHPVTYGEQSTKVTVSIGIASLGENDTDSPETLFERADKALYQAKSEGRNRTVLADS
ncbi:MAG: GGDEF domain-containing protein [Gammaproteobacteria bacterium]